MRPWSVSREPLLVVLPNPTKRRRSRLIRDPWSGVRALTVVEVVGDKDNWLAFFATTEGWNIERRRMQPVPADWKTLPDSALAGLFGASVAPRAPYRAESLQALESRVPFPEFRLPTPETPEWEAYNRCAEMERIVLTRELSEVRARIALLSAVLTAVEEGRVSVTEDADCLNAPVPPPRGGTAMPRRSSYRRLMVGRSAPTTVFVVRANRLGNGKH